MNFSFLILDSVFAAAYNSISSGTTQQLSTLAGISSLASTGWALCLEAPRYYHPKSHGVAHHTNFEVGLLFELGFFLFKKDDQLQALLVRVYDLYFQDYLLT